MTAARRRRLLLAYDGGKHHGWQLQPGVRTIQGDLEQALCHLYGQPVRVAGSGRTDAGVHALGQVAHFDEPHSLPDRRLRGALNGLLDPAIRVRSTDVAPPGFHSLHSAVGKTYVYQFHLSQVTGGAAAARAEMLPFRRDWFHPVRADLDLGAMRRAARLLVGTHDFSAFGKTGDPGRPTVKTVRAIRLLPIRRGLRLFVSGDGFLYGMVRLMGGALLAVGQGRLDREELAALLASRRPERRPASLPARGLFLWRVHYPAGLAWPPTGT